MRSSRFFSKVILLALLIKQIIFSVGCMAVTAEHYSEVSPVFLYLSFLCFFIAIISLILGIASKKEDAEKYWTGVAAGMIMGLIFLA